MKLLCIFCLVAGVVGPNITYLDPVCAVTGSTVTLVCTFIPKRFFRDHDGTNVPLQIKRVVWCRDHKICHGTTPSVYDSTSQHNNSHFRYLGNMKDNCTLQIRNIVSKDSGIYRFRMEANDVRGHYTGQRGVEVTVIDGVQMEISSSTGGKNMSESANVMLHCTARCTFYDSQITWYRDGHTLPESGPTLQLSPVTALHSGNYSCALRTITSSRSPVYRLHVETAPEEKQNHLMLIIGATVGVVLAVILVIVVLIIKRKRTEAANKPHRIMGNMGKQKDLDNTYSNVERLGRLEEMELQHEAGQAVEDMSYAAIQFRHNTESRQTMEADEDVVYTAVATRR